MKRPRWSLRDMLIIIPATGLLITLVPGILRKFDSLGTRSDPTLIVAPLVFVGFVALLLIATLGAIYGQPSRRAFRFGFVLVASVYFVLASSYWTTSSIAEGLLTTAAQKDLVQSAGHAMGARGYWSFGSCIMG